MAISFRELIVPRTRFDNITQLWGIVVAGSRHPETHFLAVNFRLLDARRHTLQGCTFGFACANFPPGRNIANLTYYYYPPAGNLFSFFVKLFA